MREAETLQMILSLQAEKQNDGPMNKLGIGRKSKFGVR